MKYLIIILSTVLVNNVIFSHSELFDSFHLTAPL